MLPVAHWLLPTLPPIILQKFLSDKWPRTDCIIRRLVGKVDCQNLGWIVNCFGYHFRSAAKAGCCRYARSQPNRPSRSCSWTARFGVCGRQEYVARGHRGDRNRRPFAAHQTSPRARPIKTCVQSIRRSGRPGRPCHNKTKLFLDRHPGKADVPFRSDETEATIPNATAAYPGPTANTARGGGRSGFPGRR
jgi:hypothetical protein